MHHVPEDTCLCIHSQEYVQRKKKVLIFVSFNILLKESLQALETLAAEHRKRNLGH